MSKWKFREDMLNHYINEVSSNTFKDAENRLNYLEEKEKLLKLKIEDLLEEIEDETENRHMNDLEYSRYCTLNEVLELIDEL